MRKDYERQVGFGCMFLDTMSGTYRPTWKGASLMAWKLTWPVNAIRCWWMRTKARATMRWLGTARSCRARASPWADVTGGQKSAPSRLIIFVRSKLARRTFLASLHVNSTRFSPGGIVGWPPSVLGNVKIAIPR